MWVGAVAAGGGRFLLFFLFGVNVPLFSLSLNQKLASAKGIELQRLNWNQPVGQYGVRRRIGAGSRLDPWQGSSRLDPQ